MCFCDNLFIARIRIKISTFPRWLIWIIVIPDICTANTNINFFFQLNNAFINCCFCYDGIII